MSIFSIDLAAEQITDHRTRDYFKEVSRSFSNECYRSSLVMLWTVVVCDLLYKLQSLRDLYQDTSAGKLLDDVEAKRATNPNSPDWEAYLLDEVASRTKMLETTDHVQLKNLQQLRHLSAHPVLTGTDLLFHPSKETTRAQIRMALEGVLLKPALFSKGIVSTFVEDIAVNQAVLILPNKLKTYLEARYFTNMPSPVEGELFRALWKFCFRTKNADTDANREINGAALGVIYNRNPIVLRAMIQSDHAYFSNVGSETELLDALIDFLADHGELYEVLNDGAKVLIDGQVNSTIDNRVKASFSAADLNTHLTSLLTESAEDLEKMKDSTWQNLLATAEDGGQIEQALALAIKIYGDSGSYDAADRRFTCFISPIMGKFTKPAAIELLGAIENNSQTYDRGRAAFDHPELKDAADALQIDTMAYPNFTKSL